jgi:hypothetical protein
MRIKLFTFNYIHLIVNFLNGLFYNYLRISFLFLIKDSYYEFHKENPILRLISNKKIIVCFLNLILI